MWNVTSRNKFRLTTPKAEEGFKNNYICIILLTLPIELRPIAKNKTRV